MGVERQSYPGGPDQSGAGGAPRAVKLAVAGVVAILLGGALWLMSVRGEALLIDLYTAGAQILCL
jgi:hypothetical protein